MGTVAGLIIGAIVGGSWTWLYMNRRVAYLKSKMAAKTPSPVQVVPAIRATPVVAQLAPIKVAPVEVTPIEVTPVEVAPVEIAPVEVAPVEVAPVEVAPVAVDVPAPYGKVAVAEGPTAQVSQPKSSKARRRA